MAGAQCLAALRHTGYDVFIHPAEIRAETWELIVLDDMSEDVSKI